MPKLIGDLNFPLSFQIHPHGWRTNSPDLAQFMLLPRYVRYRVRAATLVESHRQARLLVLRAIRWPRNLYMYTTNAIDMATHT
jgi:hypothetical protein